MASKQIMVQIHTKSNYKGLNGTFVPVVQFLGNLIACKHDGVTFDISLKEVLQIREIEC